MTNVAAWGSKLYEARVGIMLHFDGSASDAGAVAWMTQDPRCKVSYHRLVLDDGKVVEVAPWEARAWHAGVCKPSDPKRLPYKDANSALLGIAVAATDGQTVTEPQMQAVVKLCRAMFLKFTWPQTETWRIVGHDTEAWPRGRKHDPTGSDPAKPVLSVQAVREAI